MGNVSEWTDSSYDPNAYEYVSSMNPNVLDASNKRSSWWFLETLLILPSTGIYIADSARSFIGFRTVQDYMGLHNGNEKQLTTDKKT
jgi:formylglycine-generating enzyme required for sulfatase activity